MENFTIGIIGLGVVGSALKSSLKKEVSCLFYDPQNKKSSSIKDILEKSSFVFVCVPTPAKKDGRFDSKIIDQTMEEISKNINKRSPIVVIKSTTIPTKIIEYKEKYPNMKLLVCPEFLREKTAKKDFLNPEFRVIGGKKIWAKKLQLFFEKYTKCKKCSVAYCSEVEASLAKYAINCFLATKVVFMNEFYFLFKGLDKEGDWDNFTKVIQMDKRLGNSHFRVPGENGKFGYAGRCFPKDVKAIIEMAKDKYKKTNILEMINKVNNKIYE